MRHADDCDREVVIVSVSDGPFYRRGCLSGCLFTVLAIVIVASMASILGA